MEKKDIKKINDRMDAFVFDDYPVFEEDILFEERLCDIILKNKYISNYKDKDYDLDCHVDLSKSISISKKFLRELKPEYEIIFNELLDNKIINFIKTDDIKCISHLNVFENIINVYIHENIGDVFEMVHEFMHYTNSNRKIVNDVSGYYTEAFSNWVELLLPEFIKNNYPRYCNDTHEFEKTNFKSLYQNNICTKIILELIKNKINGIEVNDYNLAEIFSKILKYCPDLDLVLVSNDVLISKLLSDELEIEGLISNDIMSEIVSGALIMNTRNTNGIVLACTMANMDKNDIIELNDNLCNMDFEDLPLCLGLEYKDEIFDLTEDSYKKLEDNYVKRLKKL